MNISKLLEGNQYYKDLRERNAVAVPSKFNSIKGSIGMLRFILKLLESDYSVAILWFATIFCIGVFMSVSTYQYNL